jgi:hypothetical protein
MDPENWKRWEMSLMEKPEILTTQMSLTPIYRLVRLVDKKKGQGCREALEDILGKFSIDSDNQGNFLMYQGFSTFGTRDVLI